MNSVSNISDLDSLKVFINERHIRIVKKPSSVMMGYAGLHIEKGEEVLGLKIPRNTIWIDQNLRGREYFRTLKHEVEELVLMQDNGLKSFPAHRIALRDESK